MKMTDLLNAIDRLPDEELKDLIEYAQLELELRDLRPLINETAD